jgi:hypothetical protein
MRKSRHEWNDYGLTKCCRYRTPDNVFRSSKWNVPNVPTLARYERLDGEVKEVGRLIEEEILDKERFKKLIA